MERQRTPGSISQKLSDFVVRQVDREKWEIEFKNNGVDGYRLQAKRGEIRQFVRIAGVERWMKKMGIKEFKVVLDD
ncbi:hypothetical protein [Nitrosomonas sp. Nm34]|uniref:hypothetical protein n=1 Tax=Nitrosomonas sp. Nm34 TaxID=1881055 RepID=UPI0011145AC1|nr:hypothetical protein [Nitrosomonas sp. Nm34]